MKYSINEAAYIAVKAIKAGRIKVLTACEKCGAETKLHKHHPDYSKPELVVWLCPLCHRRVHIFLSWWRDRVEWVEFCHMAGIRPEEGRLPVINKKTLRPIKKSVFRLWQQNTHHLRMARRTFEPNHAQFIVLTEKIVEITKSI